jgi:hypothetical protein
MSWERRIKILISVKGAENDMGCQNCGATINGVCKVCALLDSDLSVKVVRFCASCNEYICNECEKQYIKRFHAFLVAKAGEMKNQWNELLELWKK